ncbi:MAG: hypothetical protein ACF8GE_08640 [Phycisphaerales bacterium JB043]
MRASLVGASVVMGACTLLVTPVATQSVWSMAHPEGRDALVSLLRDTGLLFRTAGVSLGIGVGATLLAWPVSWWARASRSPARVLLLLPLILPSYLVTSAYSLLRAPGTWLGDLVAQSSVETIRGVVLSQAIGGMVLWSWPIAVLVLWIAIALVPREQLDALRLAAGSRSTRLLQRARLLRAGVLTSVLVVAMLMAGSSVPLHIAGLPTHAIEVWRTLDEHTSAVPAWGMSLPLVALAGIVGSLLVARARRTQIDIRKLDDERPSWSGRLSACALWSLAVLVPLLAMLYSLRITSASLRSMLGSNSEAWMSSLHTSLLVMLAVSLLGIGTSLGMSRAMDATSSRLVRWSLALLVAMAFVPGVLIGSSLLELSIAVDLFGWIGTTRWGSVVAHVARFGFLSVGIVVCLRAWEPRTIVLMRRSEPDSFRSWLATTLRPDALAIVGASLVVSILSLHEIESSVVLVQPGSDNLPRRLLNLLHYNRVQELIVSMLMLMVGGIVVLVCATLVGARLRAMLGARARALTLLLLSLCCVSSCDGDRSSFRSASPPLVAIGEPGRSPGQFIKPRAIDSDDDSLWVVDRSGRVQRLDSEGNQLLEWMLPSFDKGFPTGITVGGDGRIYIADTHEHRVLVCRLDGESLEIERSIGGYGHGDGEFIYPTDIAIETRNDAKTPSRYFVSEYGGNDRVSAFDANWEFLFSFGREGLAVLPDEVVFCRPQSMAYDNARRELLVADACNHRLGRFTRDGELLAWHDTPLRHPYGLTIAPDASVLVTEFGNNRVTRIDWESGRTIDIYGRPGRDEQGLIEPWACAVLDGLVYVLDTGKHRIVSFELPPRQEDTAR